MMECTSVACCYQSCKANAARGSDVTGASQKCQEEDGGRTMDCFTILWVFSLFWSNIHIMKQMWTHTGIYWLNAGTHMPCPADLVCECRWLVNISLYESITLYYWYGYSLDTFSLFTLYCAHLSQIFVLIHRKFTWMFCVIIKYFCRNLRDICIEINTWSCNKCMYSFLL